MRLGVRLLIGLLRRSTRARRDLLLESIVLRQQLAVYAGRPKRSRLRSEERLFWSVVGRIQHGAGVPAGIVATAEDLYYHPHPHARGVVVAVDHTEARRVEHAGVSVHLSATPGDAARPTTAKGEHNDYVFSQALGLDRAERDRLKAAGVLR